MTTPYIDPNLIFAENAPVQDKPAAFQNYDKGWDESRNNDGRPLIPQMNYLTQQADLKNLYIHENGAALPYKEGIAYEENAVVVKDGVLQQWKGEAWVIVNKNIHNDLTGRDTAEAHPASAISDASGVTQQEINDSRIRIVSTKSDLLTVSNPQNKQVVYVLENEKRYIYNSTLTDTDNGVTVIDKWEMELQEAYYSSWFCESESGTDQSVGLQTGHDYATLKGRPFIVDNKIDCDPAYIGGRKICLEIRSNSVTHFTVNGEIRLLPVDVPNYHLIMLRNNVDNFVITNPVLRGDRRTHIGTTGEWGHGLTVYECKNGYIHRPKIFDCWGDGLYVGRIWGEANGYRPTNVTIFEPYIEGIRRNGMAFTSGKNVNIVRPYIWKVGDYDGVLGTFPRSGIDIEPEQQAGTPKSILEDCRVIDATIKDTHTGLIVAVYSDDVEHSLTFEGTTTIDGATNTSLGFFHGGSNCSGYINIDHIVVKRSVYIGLSYAWNGASNLKLNIDKLTINDSNTFNVNYVLNGNFIEKQLGNLKINAVYGDGIFSLGNNDIANLSEYTDGSIFRKGVGSNISMRIYSPSLMPKYSPKFFLDGETLYSAAGSTTPARSANTIWQDPSAAAPATVVAFNTAADFRRLKIGLSNNTTQIGQGCNIIGLNLLIDGVAKTKAQCKTLGGWLEFQNVSGGRTIIYNSYGDWVFS